MVESASKKDIKIGSFHYYECLCEFSPLYGEGEPYLSHYYSSLIISYSQNYVGRSQLVLVVFSCDCLEKFYIYYVRICSCIDHTAYLSIIWYFYSDIWYPSWVFFSLIFFHFLDCVYRFFFFLFVCFLKCV